jgi:hypothetical protein
MKKSLLLLFLCSVFALSSSAYYPKRKNTITLVNVGPNIPNYKLMVVFNGATFISSNLLKPTFADVRFSTDSTCPVTFLNHYIERIQAGVGTIWVDLPALQAGTSKIYMYFGDNNAVTTSNINNVFPNRYILETGTVDTLAGIQNYDWFEVKIGATLRLTQSDILTVNATRIKIDGVVDGIGKGYSKGSTSNSNGNGPGGGTFSPLPANAGAGGGSYGGVGGTGGFDAGDSPGAGGPTYGTAIGLDIDFGSAGGSSSNLAGGNGGGAIRLNAKTFLSVSGTVTMTGQAGATPILTSSLGGGGGAGGCILMLSDNIEIAAGANLWAIGGNGSDFLATPPNDIKDGGGGGGGGRIKYFYGKTLSTAGALVLTSGGVGGKNGNIAIGANGATGTVNQVLDNPYANYTSTSIISYIPCFPLPVNFLSFDVSKTDKNQVSINWVTENEQNVSHYEIEQSTDAVNFRKIGIISSVNTTSKHAYKFVDENPQTGVNYYRLKQLDLDGKFNYTEIESARIGQLEELNVFPNPATSTLSISINNFKNIGDLKIRNGLGQLVKSMPINNYQVEINIQDLPNGIYYVSYNGNKSKFIKQ